VDELGIPGSIRDRNIHVTTRSLCLVSRLDVRFSQIDRCFIDGAADLADFSTSTSLVEEIHEAIAKIHSRLVQNVRAAYGFVCVYVDSSDHGILTLEFIPTK
jgi:hypothetical protein